MSEPMPSSQDHGHVYERDQVVKIINSVLSKVEKAEDDSRHVIYNELQSLKRIIEEAPIGTCCFANVWN